MPPTHTDEGILAALVIRRQHPDVAVMGLSQFVEECYATDLLSVQTSSVGYLLKDRVARVTARAYFPPEAGSSIHPVTRWISPDEDGSVSRIQEYRQALNARPREAWARFLDEHSGLPGPRGDLELVQAAADEGDREWFDELAADPDEYRATVGAVGLGRLLAERADDGVVASLVRLASDPRWRVREGVAMALQRLGDADPPRLWEVAAGWATDEDPLVQRAAVAGVCEPRLLRTPDAARQALDVCAAVTASLAARPPRERRLAGVRVLRQALGYGWSVVVAADPPQGLPRFRRLQADPDPDVAWIVRENRKKARLIRVLPQGDAIEG